MRRLRSLKFAWIGLAAVCLAGCANLGKRPFNRAANEDVKTIGLIEPANDDEYRIADEGGATAAGLALGVLGGAVGATVGTVAAGIDAKSKTGRFTRLVKEHNFSLFEDFQEAVASELQDCGYSVKVIKRQGPGFKLMDSYEGLETDVDAYLDASLVAGYIKAEGYPAYVPALQVRIRLVKREPRRTLYQANYFYGVESGYPSVENVPSEQGYSFDYFEDLMNDPGKAAEGLSKGASLISKRIAGALSRGEQ
jgi:hypothetical protein